MESKGSDYSAEQVCKLLKDGGFDCSVVEAFRQNKIDGIEFVNLARDNMKEPGVSALGDRKNFFS